MKEGHDLTRILKESLLRIECWGGDGGKIETVKHVNM